jgi:hypothetical protein
MSSMTLYLTLSQILNTSVPDLYFLTPTCSQVRFDVGPNNFILTSCFQTWRWPLLMTDFGQPGATRGWRSDRPGSWSDHQSWLISGRFRSSQILSPNPLFRGQHDTNSGRTTPGLYNEPLMADWGPPMTSTKNLSIHSCFYLFYPNSPLQTLIMFSLCPSGSLRCSRWPCHPRTTLRWALPNGVPPEGAIKGDRCEFAHNTEADGQTATTCD